MAVDPARLTDIVELAIGPFELALAAIVYAAAPRQRANRALAIVLTLEGLGVGGLANGFDTIAPPDIQAALFQATLFSIWVANPVYLVFVAASLDTSLTRPLRTKSGRWILVALALAAAATFLLLPSDPMTRFRAVLWATLAVSLATLAVTIQAFTRARPGSPQRKRAKAFLVAFALRDVSAVVLSAKWLLNFGLGGWFAEYNAWLSFWLTLLWIPYAAMVAYGTLRGQLFDIDVRVQRILQRTALVVLVAVVFFGLSEGLETVVPFDSLWLGLAGAALITLLLTPLQSWIGRVTARLVPDPREETRLHLRKEEVYLTAYESAAEDGRVGDRERRVLQALGDRLGLSAADVRRLESEKLA